MGTKLVYNLLTLYLTLFQLRVFTFGVARIRKMLELRTNR